MNIAQIFFPRTFLKDHNILPYLYQWKSQTYWKMLFYSAILFRIKKNKHDARCWILFLSPENSKVLLTFAKIIPTQSLKWLLLITTEKLKVLNRKMASFIRPYKLKKSIIVSSFDKKKANDKKFISNDKKYQNKGRINVKISIKIKILHQTPQSTF